MALYTEKERIEFEESMQDLILRMAKNEGLDMETAAASAVLIRCFGVTNKEVVQKMIPALSVLQEVSNVEDIDDVQTIELAMTLSRKKHLFNGMEAIRSDTFKKEELREVSDRLKEIVYEATGRSPRKSYVDSLIRARNIYLQT